MICNLNVIHTHKLTLNTFKGLTLRMFAQHSLKKLRHFGLSLGKQQIYSHMVLSGVLNLGLLQKQKP